MRIDLTEEQRRQLDTHPEQPVHIVDPDNGQGLVLLRADQFERMCGEPGNPKQHSKIQREVPVGIRRSRAAFFRDLPELLKQVKRRGQWVGY